jgi:hypothetical protein
LEFIIYSSPALQIDALLDFPSNERSKVCAGCHRMDLADQQLQERVCAGDDGRPLDNGAIKIPTGHVLQVAAPSAVQLPGSRAHPSMLQRRALPGMGKVITGGS